MGLIVYNGTSSKDMGVIVEKFPQMSHGARRGEAYTIAGRNGTFYDEDGTWDNYIQSYKIAVKEGFARPADKRCADLAAWLSPGGFNRLEDSFEPEYFKLARFAGPLNVEQIMGRWGKCPLEFECLPERWLKSGEAPLTLSYSPTIINPTAYTARPLIVAAKNGDITITVDNVSILKISDQGELFTAVIDCDAGTIQTPNGDDLYGSTTFYTTYHDFPEIPPGEHEIAIVGGGTLLVTPRWYVL